MSTIMQDSTTTAARELPDTITGPVLKAMRVAVGMSTHELAETIGCSHQHLSRIESGKRSLTAGLGWPLAQAIADQLTHLNAEHYRAAKVDGGMDCSAIWDAETAQRMDEMVERSTGHPCPGRTGGHCPVVPRALTEAATA